MTIISVCAHCSATVFEFGGQSVMEDLIPIMGQAVQITKYEFEHQAIISTQNKAKSGYDK